MTTHSRYPEGQGSYFKGQLMLLRSLFPGRIWAVSLVSVAAVLSLFLSLPHRGREAQAQAISVNTSPGTAQVLRVYNTLSGIEVRASDGVTPIFRFEPGGFVRFFGVVIVQQAVGAGTDPIEFRDTTGTPLFRMEGRTVHFLGDVVIDGKLNGIAPTAGVYQ